MPGVPGDASVARRPSDRKALVEYVEATPNLQETDWLEWKSGYDLSTATGRASTARQIIGFANRMPDQARRHAEGFAYLLLGVEPGTFHGTPVHDSADIENWLRPYVGDGIVYDIDYVTVGGVEVLFITVDPPEWGDNIHSLRKEAPDEYGKAMRAGSVYVRKSGKTETASDEDIDRLTERARRQGTALALTVEASGPLTAPSSELFSAEARNAYLEKERRRLLGGLPDTRSSRFAFVSPIGESRSIKEFEEEVERWVARTREAWRVWALVQAVVDDPQQLSFVVVNDTDDNFEAVQVEATIPVPRAIVLGDADEFHQRAKLSDPPVPWGRQHDAMLRSLTPRLSSIGGPDIEALDGKATLVRFPPLHVRPKSRHDVGSVVLALVPEMAGRELEVSWRITSTSTRGDQAGIAAVAIETAKPAEPPRDI